MGKVSQAGVVRRQDHQAAEKAILKRQDRHDGYPPGRNRGTEGLESGSGPLTLSVPLILLVKKFR
jgi:hypothetical protein